MSGVLFKKPDGSFVTVPAEYAAQAQAKGYVPSTPEQASAAQQPLQAGLEGAARGATMGFGEEMLSRIEAEVQGKPRSHVRAEMRARKEENPLAAGVGEIGGVLGTSLVTGGGASALVGGGMRGALLEGGLYGMGSMVSESALENRDLTADRLAAGLVGGALVSGGAHGAFSLVGKGVSAGMKKFGGQGLKGALEEAAYKIEERSLSEAQAGAMKRLERSGGKIRDVVEIAREKGLPIKFTNEAVEDVGKVLEGTHAETGAALKVADSIRPLSDDAYRAKFLAKVEQELTDQFDGRIAAQDDVTSFIKAELRPLVVDTALTRERLYQFQSDLRKRTSALSDTGIKKDVYNAGRKLLRNNIFEDVGNITPGEQGRLTRLQKDYAKLSFLQDAMATRLAKNEATGGVTGIGMMDVLRGGGMGGSVGASVAGPIGAPLGALVGAYTNRAIRERGGAMSASALRAISESRVTNGITRGLGTHLSKVLSVAPEVLGAYRYPLAVAAAKGTDALLQEHLRLASGEQGQDYLAKVALPVESAEEVDAAGARLAVLDALERSTQEHQDSLDSAVDGLFGAARGRKASVSAPLSLKGFEVASASIAEILKDPNKAFESVPEEIRAGAPATSAQAAAKLVHMAQFLDSKMPKDPNEGLPPSVATPWQPSPSAIDKFHRYRDAVEDPARVLKNMAAGYISPEQVEAIKAVYPSLYVDLQQKIGERLMMQKKPLAYTQRLAMSALLGPQVLGMSQAQMQVLQQSQMEASAGADQAGGGMKKPDGRQDVNQEDNIDTQAQRIERR